MTPLALLKLVTSELVNTEYQFALAGGLAASVYRDRPRLTNDVDLAFMASDGSCSRELAESVIKRMGLDPSVGWIVDSQGALASGIALVVGRFPGDVSQPTLDLLLPILPWVPLAIERAKYNKLDYGFGLIPTITPEDLILSKAFALQLSPDRLQDLDDIRSIFAGDNELDLEYLRARAGELSISSIPGL